jgi:hypothetical protein
MDHQVSWANNLNNTNRKKGSLKKICTAALYGQQLLFCIIIVRQMAPEPE